MELPGFSKKPNPSDVSENLKNLDSLEMKLIRSINEIEEVKSKIDESSLKILNEIKSTYTDMLTQFKSIYSDIEVLSDFVKHVPKETLVELSNIKKNQPMVYDELKQTIGTNIRSSILGAVDMNILKIIKAAGKVTSLDLLDKVEASHVCSKNTLFSHLTHLEERGVVVKKRDGHKIIYSVSEAMSQEMDKKAAAAKVEPKVAQPVTDGQKTEPSKAIGNVKESQLAQPTPAQAAETAPKEKPETPLKETKNLDESQPKVDAAPQGVEQPVESSKPVVPSQKESENVKESKPVVKDATSKETIKPADVKPVAQDLKTAGEGLKVKKRKS